MEMRCFVVIYKGNELIQQNIQLDDGFAAHKYAKEKGYSVMEWPMYGLTHFSELDAGTKEDIKSFVHGLR